MAFPLATAFAEGDLVSIDVGLVKDGFCSDMAVTVPVGEVSSEVTSLLTGHP